MFWTVESNTQTTFVGSVHLLPPEDRRIQWLIDEVLPSVEAVVFETDFHDIPDGWGTLTQGTLASIVGMQRWRRLTDLAESVEIDPDELSQLHVWAAAQRVSFAILQHSGAEFESGVDPSVRSAAESLGKPMSFLETPLDQRRACESAPLLEQLGALDYLLDHSDRVLTDFEKMQTAWRNADIGLIEPFLAERMALFPKTFEHLVVDRNRSWVPALANLVSSRASSLVVVGALHFCGPSGLPALLEARGVTLQPWRNA